MLWANTGELTRKTWVFITSFRLETNDSVMMLSFTIIDTMPAKEEGEQLIQVSELPKAQVATYIRDNR